VSGDSFNYPSILLNQPNLCARLYLPEHHQYFKRHCEIAIRPEVLAAGGSGIRWLKAGDKLIAALEQLVSWDD
jgi:hypothetical protein